MAKARPKTAEELCALVESLLATMPDKQQKRFWSIITEHQHNWHHRKFIAEFARMSAEGIKVLMGGVIDMHKLVEEEHAN